MRNLILAAVSFLFLAFNFIDKDWVTIKSEEGFKISFPSKPVEEHEKVDSESGELKMNMMICEADSTSNDDNLVYLFNYTDYPEKYIAEGDSAQAQAILDGSVSGGSKNVKGTLLSSEDLTFKGYPGKFARIDYGNGSAIILMKCLLVKNRIYLLEIITSPEKEKNKNQQKFFDSFDLLN